MTVWALTFQSLETNKVKNYKKSWGQFLYKGIMGPVGSGSGLNKQKKGEIFMYRFNA